MVKLKVFIFSIIGSILLGFLLGFATNFFFGKGELAKAKELIDTTNKHLASVQQTNIDLETRFAGLNDTLKRLTSKVESSRTITKNLDKTINDAQRINDECRAILDTILAENP